MAIENAKEFLKKAMEDKDLHDKIRAADPFGIAAIAKEAGFDVTDSELEQAAKELKKAVSGEAPAELAKEDLDTVAGGVYWTGEDAPDGHEMGCAITYHHRGYSEETGNWCKKEYYCITEYRTNDYSSDDDGDCYRVE